MCVHTMIRAHAKRVSFPSPAIRALNSAPTQERDVVVDPCQERYGAYSTLRSSRGKRVGKMFKIPQMTKREL